jgi:transposase
MDFIPPLFRQGSLMSQKKYIVSLTDEERAQLQLVVQKLLGTSQKVKRANILLKADDSAGSGWPDAKIAEACDCSTKTVENVRQRFVEQGFDETLNGKKRKEPPVAKLLNGEQEAKIIALRLGIPPKGYGKWSLRLLACRVVELEIVDAVSYQTIRRTLKKTA